MDDKLFNFIQSNSPDGGFLQSEYWRNFQKSVGRKTHNVSTNDEDSELTAYANIVTHTLPIAGKYFYAPRGPIVSDQRTATSDQYLNKNLKTFLDGLINLAKKNNIGWIRVEPANEEILQKIKENLPKNLKIKKSSVDMQPREILVLDISKNEEDVLAGMKQKTRYNIRLAKKRGVKIIVLREEKYIEEFLKLVKITAGRDKITVHPEKYYRQMFEAMPGDILKLYIAEYEGKIIAANLVAFFGKTATYLHGASDNIHREVMAPYLLQWQQILDAKKNGCERYDFGGVKTGNIGGKSWEGVTKFKLGFAPHTETAKFPGCYDIILKPGKYNLYRALQKIKRIL